MMPIVPPIGALCSVVMVTGALLVPTDAVRAQQYIYVANQSAATVSVIDASTQRVVETIDLQQLGFAANAKPHHTQVEPDGSVWYLTMIGAGKVLKFDRNNRVIGSADMAVPGLMSLHPTLDVLFVGRSMAAVNPPSKVAVIRRQDMDLLDEIDVFFPRPHALVSDPRGGRFYTASLGVNQLATVDAEGEGGEVTLVDVPGPAGAFVQLAISPDAHWLSLTAQATAQVHIFDISNPGAPKLARSITTKKGPFESAFTPDGKELWVTNLDANVVSVIETGRWAVTDVIEHNAFGQPHGIAIAPDGRTVWIGNRHQPSATHGDEGEASGPGTIVAICRATKAVATVVPVGEYAAGMSMASGVSGSDRPSPCP